MTRGDYRLLTRKRVLEAGPLVSQQTMSCLRRLTRTGRKKHSVLRRAHSVCWHKRKDNLGGVSAVMVNHNIADLAVPENNFGLAGLQIAGKVRIERA